VKEQIHDAMKTAMKAGDKVRTSVLRMLLSDIQYTELAGQEALDGVVAYAKKLEKSIEEFRRVGRHEEVARIEAEHRIVAEFLPQKLSEAQMETLVDQAIVSEKIASMKDAGRAMKKIMGEHGKEVDGRKIQEMLKKKLGG
jgi:hypothetical protein